MQNVIERISQRLGLTAKEAADIISQALRDPSYEERLVDILGYEMLDEAEMICRNRSQILVQDEVLVRDSYVEHILPEVASIVPGPADLVDVGAAGEDSQYFSYATFNAVQSKVFPAAYRSDQNMLVCAPTGAGKTDVALLAVLRALARGTKVMYLVPMKALATEISAKYRKQLLQHRVIEYTGDTEIGREEVQQADVVVATPEKFDVATRKQCNVFQGEIGLVVIDEIHLLQDDRGPVIEALVGRIFRYIELTQRSIRIVGLSATLPNYKDVAQFLRAGHVFSFDQSYRPVPLKISVIGMIRKSKQEAEEELVRRRVGEYLDNGKQVLVFVHSRGETVRVAKLFIDEGAKVEADHKLLKGILLSLARSRVGVHHAGLPREVRLHMEEAFKAGRINVLVSTSTLAWGVNLPAHAVIIKGTRFYDSEKGRFCDLGILDVLQIFGRAGRPQFDTRGEACLITAGDKVEHYLGLLKNSRDVESRLLQHVADVMNAEVYLNTVSDVGTAIAWLKSTFMYIRMLKNPLGYGLNRADLMQEDRALSDYIVLTCSRLEESGMIRIHRPSLANHNTWKFCSTEFGRIASLYYLSHETMKTWLDSMDLLHDEDSVLRLCLLSRDFSNIASREDDEETIADICADLRLEYEPTAECKLLALARAHIKGYYVARFSLSCDMGYIAKNLRRVLMAMGETLMVQKRFALARTCCILHRNIEKQRKMRWDPANEVRMTVSRVKTMARIGVEVSSGAGHWMFVHEDNQVVFGDVFDRRTDSFVQTASNVLRIEIIATDRWMETERVCHVAQDCSLDALYRDGVHECEHPWSITGEKTSCVHFRVLGSLHDLMDEQSARRLEHGCDNVCRVVLTNRRIDVPKGLQLTECYSSQPRCIPGVSVSLLHPEIPPGFVRYILCSFSLNIRFVQVYCRSFRERQQTMTSSILSMIDPQSRPMVVVASDRTDMRTTAQELRTRLFLRNMSTGVEGATEVMCGTPQGEPAGVFVTTFEKAHCIQGSPLVVFKGCSGPRGFYPVFEVLRVCDQREAFIYENPDHIEYLNRCVLENE